MTDTDTPADPAPPSDEQINHDADQLLTIAAELTKEDPDHPDGALGHLIDLQQAAAECNDLAGDEATLARIQAAACGKLSAACALPAHVELTAAQLATHLAQADPGRRVANLHAAAYSHP
jgi:hypothetical protein